MQVLRFPFDHRTDTASLRHASEKHLRAWQEPDVVDDTLLVVTELIHNVVQHTGGGGELVISRPHDVVLVEVSDHSRDLPRLLPADPRRVGGRGMLLVDAISDGWGTRLSGAGKVVWVRLPAMPAGRSVTRCG